jgi:hypothetical protein
VSPQSINPVYVPVDSYGNSIVSEAEVVLQTDINGTGGVVVGVGV